MASLISSCIMWSLIPEAQRARLAVRSAEHSVQQSFVWPPPQFPWLQAEVKERSAGEHIKINYPGKKLPSAPTNADEILTCSGCCWNISCNPVWKVLTRGYFGVSGLFRNRKLKVKIEKKGACKITSYKAWHYLKENRQSLSGRVLLSGTTLGVYLWEFLKQQVCLALNCVPI